MVFIVGQKKPTPEFRPQTEGIMLEESSAEEGGQEGMKEKDEEKCREEDRE